MKQAGVLSLLALVFGAAAPARADNPRVTLTPGAYSAVEAVEALSKASGVDLTINLPQIPDGVEVPQSIRELEKKQQLKWGSLSFAQALRLICERYQLHLFRGFNGPYTLQIGAAGPPPAGPQAEVGGMRFSLLQLSVQDHLELNFDRGRAPPLVPRDSRLQVTIAATLGDGDADDVIGLRDLTGKDDQQFPGRRPRFTAWQPLSVPRPIPGRVEGNRLPERSASARQ